MMNENNTLVVPIRLEALAVNSSFQGKPVKRWCMDYRQLLCQGNPEQPPFNGKNEETDFDKPDTWGVYLHWMVPEALRKGDQKEETGADFPALPNRWLVVRMARGSSEDAEPAFKSWLIRSDALDPSNPGGSTFAFLKGSDKTNEENPEGNESIEVTRLGKSVELESLQELENIVEEKTDAAIQGEYPESLKDSRVKSPQSLNALGFGDVNFLAYQPFINDVFSFHDDLKDIRQKNETTGELTGELKADTPQQLHYLVAGWYSHPEDDVLHSEVHPKVDPKEDEQNVEKRGETVAEILDALNWQITDADGKPKNDSDWIDKINHLQRTICFGRLYELEWQKARPLETEFGEKHREGEAKAADPKIVFANNSIDALLATLQGATGEGDDNSGTLQFLKALIYGQLPFLTETGGFVRLNQEIRKSWFKAKSGGKYWVLERDSQTGLPEPSLTVAAKEFLEAVNDLQGQTEQKQMELEELQKLFYDLWWQFHAQKDPAGNGHDSKQLSADGALAIEIGDTQKELNRLGGEIRAAFKNLLKELSGDTEDKKAPPDDISNLINMLHENHGLVEKAKPSFWKAHDPTILIAGLNSGQPFEKSEKLECLLPAQLKLTEAAKFPDNIGKGLVIDLFKYFVGRTYASTCSWQQPWNPFFLEWEAEWFAMPFEKDGSRFWDFTISDYEQKPAAQGGNNNGPGGQTITGRTFLTPQTNQLIQDQLVNLNAMMPEGEKFTLQAKKVESQQEGDKSGGPFNQFADFVDSITAQRHLSQSLMDFNNQVQLRKTQLSIIPQDAALTGLIGEQYQSQPTTPLPGSFDYQGIRQGHFKIKKLQVYDGFGQRLVLVGPDLKLNEETFVPLKDKNLTPGTHLMDSDRLIELKPRIMEYARFRFDFVDREDENRIIDIDQDVNPIVGWVLYNHLDRSLVLFNDLGAFIGELRVVHGKVTKPDPGAEIRPILKNIISLFPSNEQIFNLFLNVIDETLWSIEPNASLQEQHLAVWLGRPLALVRSRLKFEVFGAGDKTADYFDGLVSDISLPEHINPARSKPFRNIEFKVKLGSRGIRQDGLIGYYFNNIFNTVHDLKIMPSEFAKYIRPINDDNLIPLKFSDQQPLTMLVDPRAAVYAQTGILPYASLRLPDRFVNQALNRIQVNFRYYCLLTTLQKSAEADGRDRISMPLPALREGTWEWIENQEQPFDIQGIVATGKIPAEPALLRDGRLSLLDPFRKKKKD